MARGINKAILIGNLGADPETKYAPSGTAVTRLSVATSEQWKDKNTGEQQEKVEWHRVVMFNKLAEVAADYLRKGSKVYIEGRIQTRSWDGQDGVTRYTTEIIANDMQMIDSRQGGGQQAPAQQQPQKPSGGGAPPAGEQSPDFDDDIPFATRYSDW